MPEQQKQPTFKIVTGALKAVETTDGRKTLHCTASSTITDRHGDEITEECIRDMASQALAKGMTIFLNHSYKWPEDAIGKTFASQVMNREKDADGTQIWDLDLDIEMAASNDRGMKSWRLIKEDGLNAGISIGAMIEDWEYIDKDAGFWGGLRIKKVDLLEASIVGVPANQRGWVQNAVKAIKSFTASADEAEETDVPDETPTPMTLSADPIVEPAAVETPEVITESAEAAAEVESPVADPEPVETPQELPEVQASAQEGGDETDETSEDAGEVSDEDIVLALTLTIEDLKVQLKSAQSEIETLRTQKSELVDYVKDADAVLAAVANTPIGRKTSVAKTVDTFHTRVSEIYGPQIAKFLEISNG